MRRDLAYFYERPINEVFAAFEQAANQRFGKDCKTEPCVRLTFGLNFSMKYNMNGGSVTAHFMPYQNGTAVNLRYSIVQAFGARYKAHAHDLTLFVNGILRVAGQPIQLDVDRFLDYEAGVPSVAPAQASPALQQSGCPPQRWEMLVSWLPASGHCEGCTRYCRHRYRLPAGKYPA